MPRKLSTEQRRRKTEWQRRKRAEAAMKAGRVPHRTGRPPSGKPRKSRAQPPVVIPPLHTGHALFERARELTGIARDERSKTLLRRDDLIRQDALSEAVLAILEGRDAMEAAKVCRQIELDWVYGTTYIGAHPEVEYE